MSGENQANCPRMQTRGHHTWLCLLSLIVLACCASTARAQGGPPLLTDDPGTPGPGPWEINLAATRERGRAGGTFELPLLDINYGVGERIQLKFEAPWVLQQERGGATVHGPGDALAGLKWRFFEDEKRGLAVSAYPQLLFNISSASRDKGLGEDGPQLLLPLEATKSLGRVSVNGELGYLAARRRADAFFYGLAVGRRMTSRVELLGEIHGESPRTFATSELLLNFGTRLKVSERHALLFSAGQPLRKVSADGPNFVLYAGTQFTF